MIPALAEAAVTMSQSVELSIVGKATAIVIAGLVAARLASHARASVRHLLLAVTFASLVALPPLLVAGPQTAIDVPVVQTSTLAARPVPPAAVVVQPGAVEAPFAEHGLSQVSAMTFARTAWLAGTALFLAPVPIVLWRLRRIRRTGLPWSELREQIQSLAHDRGIGRPVELMRHEHVAGPITFGVLRPVIVMPADSNQWPEADVRRAVVHELEHIQRCDWVVLLVARSICACYWFHPLAWVAWRQLSLEAERSCDDAVVQNEERTDYAEQLVTLAQRLSATEEAPMLGMANRSDLSTRVSAVLDDRQRRGRASVWMAAGVVAVAGVIVLGVAPLTAVAKVEAGEAVVAPDQRERKLTGEEVFKLTDEEFRKLTDEEFDKLQSEARKSREGLASKIVRRGARPRALDRALYEAADGGDLDEVNEILAAGGNANAVIIGDGSPLIAGARSGNIAIVRRLIEAGADANLPVEGDGSPLISAAAHGHLDIVTLLLDQGADVNQIVKGDENALMCASEQGQLMIVHLLVKHGANVNERIWTPSYSGRPARPGGRAEAQGEKGEWRTAVSQARKNGHTRVVQYLMSVGARD